MDGPTNSNPEPVSCPDRVLVVDDDEICRMLISLVLRKAGCEVTEAENGQQAVDLVVGGDYGLILMDMQMPEMDGYTATRMLRDNGLETPILALTANDRDAEVERCIASGCTAHLTKPINRERLLEEIAAALEV